MADPIAQRNPFAFKLPFAVPNPLPFMAPAARVVVQAAAPAPMVLKAAARMAQPVLANPVLNKATHDLATLMLAPGQQALAWKKGFDTVGANMVTAWGTHSTKHDWDKLSRDVPGKQLALDVKSPEQLQQALAPEKRDSVKAMVDLFPSLGKTPEGLAQLKELSSKLSPEQLAGLSKRVASFQADQRPSAEFKQEVMGQLVEDLANPLRANNACGPTCSATSAQMRMARDKPSQYAEIVLDMAQGKDHRLPGGQTIKATYGESTVKSMKSQGENPSVSGLLFQANVQHFAASNASMASGPQKAFNPLFNGGLDKLFSAVNPKFRDDIDNNFVNKDFDRFNPQGGDRRVGHDPAQMEFLQQSLFPGSKTKSWLGESPNQMWSAVEKDLQRGKSVSASLYNPSPANPADRFHVVTILGVDNSSGTPTVRFHTWGGERTISLDDFKKSCTLVAPGGN